MFLTHKGIYLMINSHKRILRNYASFSGRARRADLWWWFLSTTVISIIIGIATAQFADYYTGSNIVAFVANMVYTALILLPTLTLCARRAHDVGHKGWKTMTSFAWLFKAGDAEENAYGANPKTS